MLLSTVTELSGNVHRLSAAPQPRVLVVDDDQSIRTLLTTVLKRKGFWVETARNGEEAIEMIVGMSFSAIVLDLMMPRLDGFEVIAYFERSAPDRLKQCVIVLTAAANRDLRKLDGHEVFRILRKPFELDELVSTVTECVDAGMGVGDPASGG